MPAEQPDDRHRESVVVASAYVRACEIKWAYALNDTDHRGRGGAKDFAAVVGSIGRRHDARVESWKAWGVGVGEKVGLAGGKENSIANRVAIGAFHILGSCTERLLYREITPLARGFLTCVAIAR